MEYLKEKKRAKEKKVSVNGISHSQHMSSRERRDGDSFYVFVAERGIGKARSDPSRQNVLSLKKKNLMVNEPSLTEDLGKIEGSGPEDL